MTNVEFIRLFRNPELLLSADFSALERVAGRYPYSANAQLLLAIRAELTGHPESGRYLERAASTTFDRAHLYDLLQELTTSDQGTGVILQEESLELLSLDELESPEIILSTVAPPAAEQRLVEPLSYPSFDLEEAPHLGQEPEPAPHNTNEDQIFADEPGTKPKPAPAVEHSTEAQEEDSPTSPIAEITNPGSPTPADTALDPKDTRPLRPDDPAKFSDRQPINSKEELRHRLAIIRKRQVAGEQAKPQSVKKVARRSLVDSDGLISPTLAQVFISQGQYQHAIRIYEQLALANPEKRPTFASLIQNLKRKL
ncbi:hypothetical protein [Neolewinella antarctica]|uniref:Tetratricopeptide repeat protein n=1 Tax=Neolewinella antarctica TaxID=442734 RepID=A0ABX0XEA2_9BACT|nr:hypothetical protein [Neolewinella antarctica]NJC27223.1 hypothetical protein [Neolewinella antarctica]